MSGRKKLVVVNLRSGKALRGVLYRRGLSTLTLAPGEEKVTLLEGRSPQAMDGHVVIDRANVDFYQVIQ